jgi:5-hydroxyisourate hydrolase-like protein (transthyretin family)
VSAATLDANDGLCAKPFVAKVPCKLSASGTAALDTRALPDGRHSLRILVTDVTETNAAVWGPVDITTANATCNPFPRDSTLALTAKRVPVVGFGRPAQVRGQLRTPDGVPVANAELCLAARTAKTDGALEPIGTTRTDAEGRYSLRVGPGPSREIYVVHRTPAGAVAARAMVRVRASLGLSPSRRILRNGEAVRFSGRLRGGPLPKGGALVELQARRSKGWQTFATTRTRKKGRYRALYRFTRTSGVQRYRLRARVPDQAGYAYAAGASRPITLTVSG